jgi:hypothetical protein
MAAAESVSKKLKTEAENSEAAARKLKVAPSEENQRQ